MKKYIFSIFILLALTTSVYPQKSDSKKDKIRKLTILHWNDFHARNMPYRISKKDTVTGESES